MHISTFHGLWCLEFAISSGKLKPGYPNRWRRLVPSGDTENGQIETFSLSPSSSSIRRKRHRDVARGLRATVTKSASCTNTVGPTLFGQSLQTTLLAIDQETGSGACTTFVLAHSGMPIKADPGFFSEIVSFHGRSKHSLSLRQQARFVTRFIRR